MASVTVLFMDVDGADVGSLFTFRPLEGDGAIGVGVEFEDLVLLLETAKVVEEGRTAGGEGKVDKVLGYFLPFPRHNAIKEEVTRAAMPKAVQPEDDVAVVPCPVARVDVLVGDIEDSIFVGD